VFARPFGMMFEFESVVRYNVCKYVLNGDASLEQLRSLFDRPFVEGLQRVASRKKQRLPFRRVFTESSERLLAERLPEPSVRSPVRTENF